MASPPNSAVISSFFGIVIRMYYRDHAPPHFHAEYQGEQATFTFDGGLLAGQLRSRTALGLIKEWSLAHRSELAAGRGLKMENPSNGSNPSSRMRTMAPLPLVTQAEYVDGFRIRLTFNDGIEGIVDFADWLTGPMFEPLRDLDSFKRFFVEAGAVVWPNGADIAPEALHERASASSAA